MAEEICSKPKDDGYRMPGEFEYHSGCYMIWPERTDNWRDNAIPAQNVFVEVASAISIYEPVTMCVSKRQYSNARKKLPKHIKVIEIESNDSWMRDVGPTFVINDSGNVRGIDWRFNAWGGFVDGLYSPWDKDDLVAKNLCEFEGIDYYSLNNVILEGGSFHVDGDGTAIVTEACLLHPSRNPHLSKIEIEEVLKNYLNVEKVLWIPNGIYNDETNEHVDNIINYCAPGVIVLAWTDDVCDPQYPLSKAAFEYLMSEVDAKGRKLQIHKLHIPKPIYITNEESLGIDKVEGTLPRNTGDRLAASYTNFYIANNAIILPIFNDKVFDELAINTIKDIFPNRDIVPIYSREILIGGGNIHCITQQLPSKKGMAYE